ncbi:MAG: beta-1,3-glucanase family protein [Pirellulales bacterium]
MKFWRKRKQSAKSTKSQLSLERLEGRAMMAVIPLASGQTATFYDSDGTEVKVKLSGPGQGSIELVGGVLSGAAIDTLSLTGTTGQSKLKISTRGGSVFGTTVHDVAIDNALNELGALKSFKAKSVALTGEFTADGGIEEFCVGSLGTGADVNVNGDVGRFKAENLASNSQLEVSGTLREFVAKLLAAGSAVEANQLDMLRVKQQAVGASFHVGEGGLGRAKLGWVYSSSFASEGTIGDVVVKGDAMGSAFASNINKGSDGIFGTIDDFVVDPDATGYISSLKFRGNVGGAYPSQMIDVVSSDTIGDVQTRRSQHSNVFQCQYVASSAFPLSVLQESATATGYDDNEIWIAVYGKQEGGTHDGDFYYLDPTQIRNGIPVLTTTANITGSITTSSPPTLPSFTLAQWENMASAWGSNLAFPVTPANIDWSGRILISVGVPVQAQVDSNGTVAAPSSASVTDPATGSIYDFLEFTVTGATTSAPAPSLDIDTSQVDSFGLPIKLQLFQDVAGTQPFNLSVSGTISGNTISGITNLNTLISQGLAFGQPVVASGILAPGTIITDYDPSGPTGTITLSKPALTSPTGTQSFTVEMSGPVGVAAYSSELMGDGSASLTAYINSKIAAGSEQARPFLENASPFLASGPVQVFGATFDANDIVITTTGLETTTGAPLLSNGDKVLISGVQGNTAANGIHTVTNVVSNGTASSFTLQGVKGNAAYTGFGTWSLVIEDTSTTGAYITSATASVPAVGDTVTIQGVQGNTSVNGKFKVTYVSGSSFALGSPVGDTPYVSDTGIWWLPTAKTTAITNVSHTGSGPFVITTGYTGNLANGDLVLITGVNGNPSANDVFIVENKTTTSFQLKNTTGSGTYTGGGQWRKVQAVSGATDGVASAMMISTDDTTGLAAGGVVEVAGVQGNTAANGQFVVTQVVASTSFTLGSPAGSGPYTSGGTWTGTGAPIAIADATNGGEVVIHAFNATGLNENDLVEVTGIVGNEGANGVFNISNIDLANNTFKLDGSLASGSFDVNNSLGTWKVFASLPRLISPGDLVASFDNPVDPSQLNNYFNETIDDFFVKHAKTGVAVNGGTAGNVQFNLVSSAYKNLQGVAQTLTYSGYVELDSTYNAYALTLKDGSGTDGTTYKIYYPFYDWNTPSNYAPKLSQSTATTPPWIIAKGWNNQSASQMILACDAFFADNNARAAYDMTGQSAIPVLGDLENSISAAFNRGIVLDDASTWSDNTTWFPDEGTYNYWVEYWHLDGIAYNDLAYAFAYDDKFGFSTNIGATNPGLTQITLGDWSSNSLAVSTTMLQTPSPSFVVQNGSVTLSANVTGSSPSGTVTFFVNGLPINSANYSNTAPLQQVQLSGGAATITALLPNLPNPANTPSGGGTYTVTAVYSGDSNNRPSIGYATINVNELGVSLSPASTAVGQTTQITTAIPGSDYNGTISYTISMSDGSNPISFATSTTSPTASNTVTSVAIPNNVVTFTGDVTPPGMQSQTNKITGISSMVDLEVGQTVSGTGVPAGTTILSVGVDSITLSNPVPAESNITFTTDGLGATLLVTANFVGATNSDPSYSGFAYLTIT